MGENGDGNAAGEAWQVIRILSQGRPEVDFAVEVA